MREAMARIVAQDWLPCVYEPEFQLDCESNNLPTNRLVPMALPFPLPCLVPLLTKEGLGEVASLWSTNASIRSDDLITPRSE